MEKYLKWLPVTVVAVGLIGTAYVTLDRQAAMAEELKDQSESIDENEDDIQQIQRLLIEQQGQQKVEIQELRGDVKLILRLLEQLED